MNLKTAALGTMITVGTMLGGCAKKEMPRAERIFEKASNELFVKHIKDSALNAKDSVILKAVQKVRFSKAGIDVAKAEYEYALSELARKADSIEFANKANKTALDSLAYKISQNKDQSKTNLLYSKLMQILEVKRNY